MEGWRSRDEEIGDVRNGLKTDALPMLATPLPPTHLLRLYSSSFCLSINFLLPPTSVFQVQSFTTLPMISNGVGRMEEERERRTSAH